MFAFTTIETSNLEAASAFYEAFFSVIHIKQFMKEGNHLRTGNKLGYGSEESQPHFILQQRESDSPLKVGNSVTISLNCGTPHRVRKLYEKAMELGAASVSEPKGREGGMYFLAEFLDLDGNKIGLYARPKIHLEVPKIYRRGSLQHRDMSSVRSGQKILKEIEKFKPIKNSTILDFGCGVKIAQALRQEDDPHKAYYGLDVYGEMIDYLKGALADNKKYEFATVPFKNEMYNKDGEPMVATSKLPIKNIKADVICMFSVITHMNPEDTLSLLTLLTQYANKKTRLIFSCFSLKDQEENFVDDDPSRPLLRALYNRDYLVDIIEKAGWNILHERPRIPYVMNDNFICELAK